MPRSRINGNFIDKTFSIVANILLRIIPTTSGEKRAFTYYRDATRLEIDPYDRSYILYNIGLIHTSNGEHTKALEYYFRALERNPFLPQAFNNMAVICHYGKELPIPTGENRPFYRVIQKLQKLGLIKLLSIGNKL
uniref:Uncharacterized protein n=1 Tax=Oryza rufipogon TaxID=4529 RepID=A0A0E0R1N3_ORYRU